MNWKEKIERVFASVAFAEEGREEDARRMAGLSPSRKTLRETIEDMAVAVAFSEAQCFEYAYAVATEGVAPSRQADFFSFLDAIGLREAPVRYVLVNI